MIEGAKRRSNGLREFFAHLEGQQGLRVLDVGVPSQANVNLITGLGHRIYTEDLFDDLRAGSPDLLERNLNYSAAYSVGTCSTCFPTPSWSNPPSNASRKSRAPARRCCLCFTPLIQGRTSWRSAR